MTGRPGWRLRAGLVAMLCLAGCAGGQEPAPIRLGVLHSLTGPYAFSEKGLVDGAVLAIEEINRAGGVLGREIEPVFADGQSDSAAFAREAERLLATSGVSAIVGCWSSADRKTVIPIVERHRSLMFYAPAYEGLEQSPNVIYTGGTPNQQTIPAVKWFLDNRGRRFFLVGSDSVWARAEHAIIKEALTLLGGTVAGEAYVPLDVHDTSAVVERIAAAEPDVIVNSLSHGIVGFFQRLRAAGVDPARTPTFSLAVGEDLLRGLYPEEVAGSYAVWPYFQSIDTPANRAFTARFRARYGAHRRTDDQINNSYLAVRLWAKAVEAAGTDDPVAVHEAARHLSIDAPEGRIWVDEFTHHLWRKVRIGQIRQDRQFEIVWTSEVVVRPVPYPFYRTRKAWTALEQDLYRGWGNRWFRPPSQGS
ncbi:MAG: urea ABC transporter substrate-binding protein [Actinomadura sp.]